MNESTADEIFNRSISIWVKADIETILARVSKNSNRPLLAVENPRKVLEELLEKRTPIYKRAMLKLDSAEDRSGAALENILNEIAAHAMTDQA